MIRSFVDKITIAPDTLDINIKYKISEAIGVFSGSGGEFHQLAPTMLNNVMERKYTLKKNGRHKQDKTA